MSRRDRRLDGPHRRSAASLAGRPAHKRVVEKVALHAYRRASWACQRLPSRPAAAVVGRAAQLSYAAWPVKRGWSNANFGHVLGLPPNDPQVRRLALAAYREYGRYLVEVMRLPSLAAEDASQLIPDADVEAVEPIWRESKGGLILAAGHVGNNEAVAAAVAGRGWPISVLADDSSHQELFEDFRRLRESWGVRIIPWRNIREIYGVLKRREMLALLLDWGYRPEGIPVKLFDAWTTLPAGPATLAAKTGSRILPITIRRRPDGRFHAEKGDFIEVASTEPAELVRATQRMADALEATIAAAPEQWYSFKPIWPPTPEESAMLERRAQDALRGRGSAIVGAMDGDAAASDQHGGPSPAALEPGSP